MKYHRTPYPPPPSSTPSLPQLQPLIQPQPNYHLRYIAFLHCECMTLSIFSPLCEAMRGQVSSFQIRHLLCGTNYLRRI